METVLIGFLYLCLRIAIILIVAYAIVWMCKLFSFEIDGNVYKMGKIIVLILVIIAVVLWLFSLESVGMGTRLHPW